MNAILLLILMIPIANTNRCPPTELAPNCECDIPYGYVYLVCQNFINTWDVIKTLHALKGYEIYRLELIKISLMYLPEKFLMYLPIKSLKITSGSVLGLESEDGDKMFEGATNSLEYFTLDTLTGSNGWRWKALTALKRLKILIITKCDVESVTSDFKNISPKTLTGIEISYNQVTYIDEFAFSTHEKLISVDLLANKIAILKRSMFPKPARTLRILMLSRNNLKNLPADLFTEMPALDTIYLAGNGIHNLPIDLFLPIFDQKWVLDVMDNDINCCSHLSWILTTTNKKSIYGKCKHPSILEGVHLSDLTVTSLQHGFC